MLGYLLLWYKPFRLYCIKRLIQYVEKKEWSTDRWVEKSNFLCYYNRIHWTRNLWMPCWTKIKEIQLNEDSPLVLEISCGGAQFDHDTARITFLKDCLKL